jgi:hypothetical protein
MTMQWIFFGPGEMSAGCRLVRPPQNLSRSGLLIEALLLHQLLQDTGSDGKNMPNEVRVKASAITLR